MNRDQNVGLKETYECFSDSEVWCSDDFKEYADVCFREFGDRVSQWTTTIEPNIISQAAYDQGFFPPERCSHPFGSTNCSAGDSTVEPYIATHIILLAHAAVYNLYKTKYKAEQNGQIGINVYTFWCYPFSDSSEDVEATQRVKDFMIGWVLNPLVFGDYPKIMKKIVGQRLPSFTESELEELKGSFDFLGLNHYTSVYIKDNSAASTMAVRDYVADMSAMLSLSRNDTSYDPSRIVSDPIGLRKILQYLKETYGNPPIYIEENGYGVKVDDPQKIKDTARIDYLSAHIGNMLDAMRNGSDVKGYFVWSFVDVFEFLLGYHSGYGLYHVDFNDDNRKRQPKLSAHWYSNFLKRRSGEISLRHGGPPEMSRNSQ